jgi:DNA-binding IclR family transcriptional regulator
LVVVEPRHTDVHVGYRAGSRHPIARGAPGIAILAGQPETDGEGEIVKEARRLGYAITRGHLQQGAVGVAAPVQDNVLRASVGVVAFEEPTVDAAVPDVLDAAGQIAEQLRRVRH